MPTGDTETIIAQKFKESFDESIKPRSTPGKSLTLKLK